MSHEWQLVPSRTQYREQLFASARMENRRCHCYIVGAMGRVDSKLFRPCAPSDTEPRYSQLSAFAFPVSPFVHAVCYFFPLLSEHASHPDNARRVPFSTAATTTETETAAKYRCRCYPATSNSIRRRDLTRWEREKKRDRDGSCRVRADRWSMKPPITRPWFPRVARAISRLAALVLNC